MDPFAIVAIIGTIATVIGVGVAYLQLKQAKTLKESARRPKADGGTLKQILERKVLRVGLFRYPPLIDYNDTGNIVEGTGLYADILRAFARTHSLQIEWCPTKLSEAIHAVAERKVDCYACIMLSGVRYRECDFVGLLHSMAVVGIVRKREQSVKIPSDLTNARNVKVAVCEGEIGHHAATTVLKIPAHRLLETNALDIAEIVAQVYAGNATVAIADAMSCKRMMETPRAERELKLVFADSPILYVPNGFMIARDDDEFGAWLDAGIRRAFAAVGGDKRNASLRAEFGNSIRIM